MQLLRKSYSSDPDGDHITISSDEELLEALDQFDGSIFKIHLRSKENVILLYICMYVYMYVYMSVYIHVRTLFRERETSGILLWAACIVHHTILSGTKVKHPAKGGR